MFAKAAELKAAQSSDGEAAGRELLEAIFASARELKPAEPDEDEPRPEDTVVNLKARGKKKGKKARQAPAEGEAVAKGWNEKASLPAGVDPDDFMSTRAIDPAIMQEARKSAIDEFRSSLEALFHDSDDDEFFGVGLESSSGDGALNTLRPDMSASSELPPVASEKPEEKNTKLFTAAAEALFGGDMESLEDLVLKAWERRMRGKEVALASSSPDAAAANLSPPAPASLAPATPAPAPPATPPPVLPATTESPALASLEDGELLLNPP